jgi:hypothetical protein
VAAAALQRQIDDLAPGRGGTLSAGRLGWLVHGACRCDDRQRLKLSQSKRAIAALFRNSKQAILQNAART